MGLSVALLRGGMLRRGRVGGFAVAGLLLTIAITAQPSLASAAWMRAEPAQDSSDSDPSEARAIVAFLPARGALADHLLDRFAARGLAVGLTIPSPGGYSPQQTLLHMAQGTRLSEGAYRWAIGRFDPTPARARAPVDGWAGAIDRASQPSTRVVPALVADAIEARGGNVAYAATTGAREVEARVAAGHDGAIERVSIGIPRTLPERVLALSRRHELVVTRLPEDFRGLAALDRLLAGARVSDLVYVVQAPPRDPGLLPTAVGADGVAGLLTSPTTRRAGLVATADLAPTVLHHLGIGPPEPVRGQRIEATTGSRQELRALTDRLAVIVPRREAALLWLAAGWAVMSLAFVVTRGRHGARAALRTGFLAAVWAPATALLTAALRPGEHLELAVIASGTLALAALTDRCVPWPAAPAVPASAVVLAHAADLFFGSPLIATSLAGPNPIGGVRFYGVGNELETLLAAAALLGTGAALTYRPRLSARWPPRVFAVACPVLGAVLGAGRLGAAVGGVITVAAGGAAAVLCSLSRRPRLPAIALGALVPVLAVGALATVELATGGSTLIGGLPAGSGPREVLEAIIGRLELSVEHLLAPPRSIALALAAMLLVVGLAAQRMLLAPLDRAGEVAARGFRAGLAGMLVATVVGTVANDSGPSVLLIGTTMLILATAYVRGRPVRLGSSLEAANRRRPQQNSGGASLQPASGAVARQAAADGSR